jgi:precorrin-8X/cobalt-precorrin-8 methylmutase
MPTRFDHYVIVDWSAASQPKEGRDSIWICHRGPDGERCENLATRHLSKVRLAEILAGVAASGERAILGFDFPFGYPMGLARRLGLSGTPWRALWDEIAGLLHDHEDNSNDRFTVAAELNRRVSNGRFPFWGCPIGFTHEFLGPKHHGRHEVDGLAEKRLIDRWMIGAQPCWKLAYTGSVGSQALTGIPVVRGLRDDQRWAARARVWPFETGLSLPEDAQIVFAEVWPSWWKVRPEHGPPNDKAQVRTVAEIFAARDHAGELAGWFDGDPNLGEDQRRIIETEEAWTLGVTAARQRSVPIRGGGQREGAGGSQLYSYLRDPAEITCRSFALIRAETDLGRFPAALRPVALRLAHAAGDTTILDEFAWTRGAVGAGQRALATGAPILVDSAMVAAGIRIDPNRIVCTLRDPETADLAVAERTTRSAAAVERWQPYLPGAVVAIGNAPTALFRLLELLGQGAPRPALVLGFPVGFVGAAEAKAALTAFGSGLEFITLHGRRGGSALAAAAVNALADTR